MLRAVFHGRAKPYENRDKQQERVVQHAEQAQANGQELADARCFLRGQSVIHAQGQSRSKNAATVHRECRQEIEAADKEIHDHHAIGKGSPAQTELLCR